MIKQNKEPALISSETLGIENGKPVKREKERKCPEGKVYIGFHADIQAARLLRIYGLCCGEKVTQSELMNRALIEFIERHRNEIIDSDLLNHK